MILLYVAYSVTCQTELWRLDCASHCTHTRTGPCWMVYICMSLFKHCSTSSGSV